MKRLLAFIAVFLSFATVAQAGSLYDITTDTSVHSTVLFVGDSNITRGAYQITDTLTSRFDGAHIPIFGSRSGTGIRGYGPATCNGCPASNYWQLRLPNILANVTPTAVVIDLGINDALTPGTQTTVGYSFYGQKIDWMFAQLPDVPVFWSTLPCTLEVAAYQTGCNAVNNAILAATKRHPNLIRVPWYAAAVGHPEYMGAQPHYTPAGYTAWSNLVLNALDAQFP